MFGEFVCHDCNRRWSSGNAWPGMGQQCLRCKEMIQPTTLEPLRPSCGPSGYDPHKQELCEKCQKLGKNCRNQEEEEEEEQSDLQSVISENSSVASDDDDDVTPVGSDEEDEEELAKQFASLKP